MNNCFEKLNISLSAENKLFSEYESFTYDYANVKEYERERTFLRCSLPFSYFENEPIGELMKKKNLTAKIFLIQSSHLYNWHRDAFRYMSFNMMLSNNPEYLTLFADRYPTDQNIDTRKFMYTPVTRLVYEPRVFYMLNSQVPHIAINYGITNRYLLTIGKFEKDPIPPFYSGTTDSTNYIDAVNELKNSNLINDANSIANH